MARRNRRPVARDDPASHEEAGPRAPVVVIHCPQCGGNVRDAELGTKTRCDYCGTELHLPEIGPAREERPAAPETDPSPVVEPVAASVEARPNVAAAVVGGLTLIAVFGAVMMYVLSLRGGRASHDDPLTPPAVDPSAPANLSASRCFSDCLKGCNPGGPNGPTCMDNCDSKCGLTKPARR